MGGALVRRADRRCVVSQGIAVLLLAVVFLIDGALRLWHQLPRPSSVIA